MATLGTFSAGQVLTAAELNAIGTYGGYSPTFTGFTIGNGSVLSQYTKINKMVHYYGRVVLGSTSSMAGPQLDISLPVTSYASTYNNPGVAHFFNNALVYTGTTILIGTTQFRLICENVASTYAYARDITGTVPFTWATGYYFSWSIFYQAA